MRQPDYSGQFKRDVRQVQKRGKDMEKLKTLLTLLIKGNPLPAAYLDHPLKGRWLNFRDAHIEPDWLLISDLVNHEQSIDLQPLISLNLS